MGGGGVRIKWGSEIFVKFSKRGAQNKWGFRNFKESVNIGNEWKKRHKCLILMLKLKVSKQTRSEVSKNKVSNNQKSITSIN